MPTYEYACKTCDEHLEVVQSFKDGALTECPACGGPLRKVFGNIGITFKGSGFYRTDNRANGHRSAAATAKAGDGKAAEGASAGTSSDASATNGSAGKANGSASASNGSASASNGSASKGKDAVASGAAS